MIIKLYEPCEKEKYKLPHALKKDEYNKKLKLKLAKSFDQKQLSEI
jgi:hypothetical protein